MRNYILSFLFIITTISVTFSQSIKVGPYLQDATPNSIFILWETDENEESIVEYGQTDSLGTIANGVSYPSEENAFIHEVQLVGLERFTNYFYRVRTGNSLSEIYQFKTPPFSSNHKPTRIVAMSDMQRDNAFPNKFNEIVEEGVIDYFQETYGENITDHLALVMIPGDLVVTGSNYDQWKNHFFDPGQSLFSNVPVYPVLGNHEQNSTYYFQYFKLPENGSVGYEEHWWYKDYSNIRIIGLNSNAPYNNATQIEWLSEVLNATCEADSIDFVFAQLHHPHKSELWTPGESNYTGEVIQLLENFTTSCDKPSIHFFGHTHGYSRGQSRDHKHLWINVATAGGAIDNWGEFPNFDYDEFSVSQDDYGFVVVEVTNDDDPKITVKRISRGDQDEVKDNIITDSLTIFQSSKTVNQPIPEYPINIQLPPDCVKLEASDFSSNDAHSSHGQSHWQVAEMPSGFAQPIAEVWKNFENWYFEEDTQADDDLTDEDIHNLKENATYYWRVRFRDKEMNWSPWSNFVEFTTGLSTSGPNLITNGGAENGLESWTIVEGIVESLPSGECNGISPYEGDYYFSVGGLCNESAFAKMIQGIDVSEYTDSIDTGNFAVNFGAYFSNFSGADQPEIRLHFLDQNNVVISSSDIITSLNSQWTFLSQEEIIPIGTRFIQADLTGTRNAGVDNDSYFDEIFVRLGKNETNCDSITTNNQVVYVPKLKVFPNPASSGNVTIEMEETLANDVTLTLINSEGLKVIARYKTTGKGIELDINGLPNSTYYFNARSKNMLIGKGSFIKL